jgi:hypothetical protein
MRLALYALKSTGLHPFDYARLGEFFGYVNFVVSRLSSQKLATLFGSPL